MQEGVVHTKTSYVDFRSGFESFTRVARFLNLQQNSIRVLQQKEKELYSTLNAASFPEFMSKIREIFREAENDRQVINRFKSGQLKVRFDKPGSFSPEDGEQLELTIKKQGDYNFNYLEGLIGNGGELGDNVTVHYDENSELFKLNITFDHTVVKNFLNNFVKGSHKGRHSRFQPGSTDMSAANKLLKAFGEEKVLQKMVKLDGSGYDYIAVKSTQKYLRNLAPFSNRKEDIVRALKDPQFRTKVISDYVKACTMLYNEFITSEASEEMKQAFKITWNEKIGNLGAPSAADLANFLFLSKGDNIKGLRGAFQELEGALVTNYIRIQKTTNPNLSRLPKLVTILGNIVNGLGEQPKRDLEILKSIGIQVKAYSFPNDSSSRMETNIHPAGLDANLPGSMNLGDYIVQATFNESNPWNDKAMREAIQQAIVQTMSFTSFDKLNVTDTVAFYLVDATQLVPASAIIQSFGVNSDDNSISFAGTKGKATPPVITIDRKPTGYDDTAYAEPDSYVYVNMKTGYVHLTNRFVEFWRGDPSALHSTKENATVWNDMYTKSISIRVYFDYRFMYDKSYSIF